MFMLIMFNVNVNYVLISVGLEWALHIYIGRAGPRPAILL